jgi:hypothetical protein
MKDEIDYRDRRVKEKEDARRLKQTTEKDSRETTVEVKDFHRLQGIFALE